MRPSLPALLPTPSPAPTPPLTSSHSSPNAPRVPPGTSSPSHSTSTSKHARRSSVTSPANAAATKGITPSSLGFARKPKFPKLMPKTGASNNMATRAVRRIVPSPPNATARSNGRMPASSNARSLFTAPTARCSGVGKSTESTTSFSMPCVEKYAANSIDASYAEGFALFTTVSTRMVYASSARHCARSPCPKNWRYHTINE